MSASDQTSDAASPGNWLANQTYLLLSFTALCWAGNAIVGRLAAGHIPPVTLSFLRWGIAFFIILPFARKHLVRDWPAIRGKLGTMIVLSITGIGAFNTLQYWALEHTQALNTLLLQSAAPLVVAVWSLILLGARLSLAQALGVLLSLKRPVIHGLSFVGFTFGSGAACLIPLLIWELYARPVMAIDSNNLLTLFYVAVFPSTLAYLCFNRGVALIGANRAAPFFHVVPVFGTIMSIVFLGERPQLFHIIGFALVLTGVFVASRKPASMPQPARGA